MVQLLLKVQMSPLDIDMYGNNSIHQAVAGGSTKVLESFLAKGADLEAKNARGHAPLDLATDLGTKNLIKQALSVKKCQAVQQKMCTSNDEIFTFLNVRCFCEVCRKFFCKKCCEQSWTWDDVESEAADRLVCRCHTCWADIREGERRLKEAINNNIFEKVSFALDFVKSNKLDVDVKLLDKGNEAFERLKT